MTAKAFHDQIRVGEIQSELCGLADFIHEKEVPLAAVLPPTQLRTSPLVGVVLIVSRLSPRVAPLILPTVRRCAQHLRLHD